MNFFVALVAFIGCAAVIGLVIIELFTPGDK